MAKNYIFSHDAPNYGLPKGKPYRGAVYVPETGQTFPSISAAARALGVDSSNISKVMRGKRKTAGGYHFEKPPKETKRERLIRKIKKDIKEANDILKEARDKKRQGFLDDVNELQDFGGDVIGNTPDNYIDDTSETLDDMDDTELENIEDDLRDKIEKAREDIRNADDKLKGYADAWGISSAEAEKYEHLISEINRTLERARANGEGTNLWYKVRDAMQNGMNPDDLADMLEAANRYFDNPGRGENLLDALSDWEDTTYNGRTWEDMQGETIW